MANIAISDVSYPNQRMAGREFSIVVQVDNLSMTAPAAFYYPWTKFDGECSTDRGVAGQAIDVTLEINGVKHATKTACAPYLGPLSGTINKGTDTVQFNVVVDRPMRADISIEAEAVGQPGEAVSGPFSIEITENPSAPNVGREGEERGIDNPYNPGGGAGGGGLGGWVIENPVLAGFIGIGSMVAINAFSASAAE